MKQRVTVASSKCFNQNKWLLRFKSRDIWNNMQHYASFCYSRKLCCLSQKWAI